MERFAGEVGDFYLALAGLLMKGASARRREDATSRYNINSQSLTDIDFNRI